MGVTTPKSSIDVSVDPESASGMLGDIILSFEEDNIYKDELTGYLQERGFMAPTQTLDTLPSTKIDQLKGMVAEIKADEYWATSDAA